MTDQEQPEVKQCSFTVINERERYGRGVVDHHQCRNKTRDESGRCHFHRSDSDDPFDY